MGLFKDKPEALDMVRKYVRAYMSRHPNPAPIIVNKIMLSLVRPLKFKYGDLSKEDMKHLRYAVEAFMDER